MQVGASFHTPHYYYFHQRTLTIGRSNKYHCTAGLMFDWFVFSSFTMYKSIFSCWVESNSVELEIIHATCDTSTGEVNASKTSLEKIQFKGSLQHDLKCHVKLARSMAGSKCFQYPDELA